jgi:hypothetical protein
MKESLDINMEPEKSYMLEFEGKVSRALTKQRIMLQLPPMPSQPPDRGPHTETTAFRLMEEELADRMKSVSQTGSGSSRMLKGPALLHKIKKQQRKIKTKATRISDVIGHTDITANPKAVARAGVVWSQIEVSRCEYQAIQDKAFETLDGDAGLAEAMVEDEEQWDWLMAIETKL